SSRVTCTIFLSPSPAPTYIYTLSLHDALPIFYNMLGSPEGELTLAQVVLYLALCPKSNAAYTAYAQARKLASETGHLDPPKHIRSEEHTSELQSQSNLVCRLLLEKKKKQKNKK